jgi:glycine oxidase
MPTDVLILGGGVIGCALAEELCRRGQRVTLIERAIVGAEASSAAAGILSAQMDVPRPGPFFDLCQAARRAYPGWIRRIERLSGARVDYAANGVLYLAASRAQAERMERRARWQRRAGLRVDQWSPAQIRRHEPAIDGNFRAGFHFPLEGEIDNARLMQALAVACRRQGVQVCERTTVRRILARGGAVTGVDTTRGRFSAPIVVNCLGSWSGLRAAAPAISPVEPARGQMVVFRAPRRLFRRPVMSDRAYIVQRRGGELLLGSTVERVGFDKRLTVTGMHSILCGARRMSSALHDLPFVGAWTGLRPYSRTRAPILGATRTAGLYVATGHFRHGILLAPTTAEALADLILQASTTHDLSPFAPNT